MTSSEPELLGDFVVGPENRLARSAVDSLFTGNARTYNPLVLVAMPGLGKSHLAQTIANRWRREFAGQSIVETTAADFARDLAVAVQDEHADAFRARFTSARLVVIDDLTQLVNKRAAMSELSTLLDAWLSVDTQVVLTSKVAPDEIAAFPPRLMSRLSGGLVLSIAPPEMETRRAILERQAASRGILLDVGAAESLADELAGTAPELLAALLDLQLSSRTERTTAITTDHVKAYFARQKPGGPNLRGIASLTAKYYGLKVSDLTSPSRRRAVVTARGVAMYLARELTGKSLEQVGAHFGGRDHTTVLHSYRTTEKRLRTDPGTRKAVTDLRSMLAIG